MQFKSLLLENLTKLHQAQKELSAYRLERLNEFYHLLTKMTIPVSGFIWVINVIVRRDSSMATASLTACLQDG